MVRLFERNSRTQVPVWRRAEWFWLLTCVATLILSKAVGAAELPVVFRLPDRVGPGDVVLLYGGNLGAADAIAEWRLPDADAGAPTAAATPAAPEGAPAVKPLQPTDGSVKFVLPASLEPGVYGVQVRAGNARGEVLVLNRPEFWFLQPTTLRPGLTSNQAPPGAEVQVVGKNFTIRGDARPHPRLALRPKGGGAPVDVPISKAEPFSLIARLPENLPPGEYELFAHPGKGGPAAWGGPLAVTIRPPVVWPATVLNVRDFGAKGDDVTDDTQSVRNALAAAAKNDGGVVYFPWGTYRLSDWLLVPARTVLRGEDRDATVLKWPLTPPKDEKDFLKAAVLIGPECGLEDLTLTARRVETILLDVQYELNSPNSIPPEATARIRPFGRGGDLFLRRLLLQHLLLAGRPEQQKPVMENPALNKLYWTGLRNAMIQDGRNCEISDCSFEGADQLFTNLVNGRIVRNSFANHMGYAWTNLGGGAINVVCENNDLHCSSSWGWGWTGMQRVYSAHNFSYNFVRGEREGMTLDISSLPTARPVADYWGTPAEVGTRDGKPFLRFPADSPSADGFTTGWTPGCFRGGSARIRAFQGGPAGGQTRTVVDNTADTVFLDKPLNPAPDTTLRKMYLEIAPRHERAHNGTTAWLGLLAQSEPAAFVAKDAHWVPQEFVGMTALVLDGRGAGQYRIVTANIEDRATLDRPWDVVPDATSVVGIWSLMRQMIVYDCRCADASAFAQMYGAFYDYTVDGCQADRTQGLWGQMGWFVQFRNNRIRYFGSFHPGLGMHGPNPEQNAPFGYTGLDGYRIRITKSGALQYPDRKMPLFADEAVGRPIPSTLGFVASGNVLQYGQRLSVQGWSGDSPPGPRPGGNYFRDVVMDANTVEHSSVGIQIGPNVGGVLLFRNQFSDVAKPLWLARPEGVLDLGQREAGSP